MVAIMNIIPKHIVEPTKYTADSAPCVDTDKNTNNNSNASINIANDWAALI